MKNIVFLISCFLLALPCLSQNFKGSVVDKNGNSLYASSIFIKELNMGLVCNEDGFYQTNLKLGSYQVEYKCLGFESVVKRIDIVKNDTCVINIVMAETPFTLQEVIISKQEDPAYAIMRKAIENAPLYANAVKAYSSDVYIKGNGELEKISGFVDIISKKSEGIKLSDFQNQVFVQESFNEINFKAPDIYEQKVKAFSSSIPDDLKADGALGLLKMSLYAPKIYSLVSPLHPKAFSYYNFRYDGYWEEDSVVINKIELIPKLKDPILFSGYIYIAENTWHIHSAELTNNRLGVEQTQAINYQNFGNKVYLPITSTVISKMSLLGTKLKMDYYTSITYKNIVPNDVIEVSSSTVKKKIKRNFELLAYNQKYKVVADSLATERDSLYWTDVRSIPLSSIEKGSFEKKDSIQQHLDSLRKKHNNPGFHYSDIFVGGQIGTDSSQFKIKYDGILQGMPQYNFVDGFWLGQKIQIKTQFDAHHTLEVSPYAYFATARHRVLGGIITKFTYAPLHRGVVTLSAGSISDDYNSKGIHQIINSFSSLIRGKNFNSFYQKDNIAISNSIDITNGLKLNTGIEIARRRGLHNNTNYTWGSRKDILDNIFDAVRSDRTSYSIGVEYTPFAYYTIVNGQKTYQRYDSPTFALKLEEGFSSWQTNNSKYRKLSVGISQEVKLSEYTHLLYNVEGGGFVGRKSDLFFADFKHFSTSKSLLGLTRGSSTFMLLGDYQASTDKYWVQSNIVYQSGYIVLKRLPFLQGKVFSESLHFNALFTPQMKPYSELGYSINFIKFLDAGIFSSFKKVKYQDFGVRLTINLDVLD